jgi:superfamily II DNA or RNA helicase
MSLRTDIIDNRESGQFVERLKTFLATSQSARFAIGYFFLSGFELIADELARLSEVRLLIGNVSNAETIEQLAEGYRHLGLVKAYLGVQANRRFGEGRQIRAATLEAIQVGIDQLEQREETERTVHTLIEMIASGRLHVRIYTRGRLHAKAYIFNYGQVYDAKGAPIARDEAGVAVIGSSNLSLAGVQHNTELNVVVRGNDNHAALVKWFDALWEESEPFSAELMHVLQESWAARLATPYEVYMKALYSLVADRLENGRRDEILWEDELTDKLADFQKVAVRQAIKMIKNYGGAFVSDVVGLGKSFVGAAIVKHFERTENTRALIICPAPLVGMWEHYNERYRLNAKVLSMGMLRQNGDPNWLARTYPERNFVLIDESHNLRRRGTQRYEVLEAFLRRGRRVCMLTATPRNQSEWDIYHQIKLFHPEEKTRLPVEPANLKEYFKLVEAGKRSLPELLSHILVRRTRTHVLRWYGYDEQTDQPVDPANFQAYLDGERRAYVRVGGRRQFFPRRQLETVEYSIEETYGGLYERLRNYIGRSVYDEAYDEGTGDSLIYARYGLWRYVLPQKRREPQYVNLQGSGANLRGLMRIMLFKRFESSVHAFRETVKRMLKIHTLFLSALAKGYVTAGEEAQYLLYEYESDMEDEGALWRALEQVSVQYKIADFDAARLQADLEHDRAILSEMLALVEPIRPEQDAKLQKLKELLARPLLRQNKCLIFTQYADTARYLYEQLNPERRREIEVIYSSNRDKAAVAGRFAPLANPEYQGGAEDVEIRVLIATDVLAEGLNLQDCNLIINYDLHWNPVRLIQRFGRVDRIGTDHSTVYGFNFLPEIGIERNLGLRERLRRRIQEIHNTIGEDAVILDRSERLNPEAFYAIYEQQASVMNEADLDETEFLSLSEAEEILRQMRVESPAEFERIAKLRDGIRSAMPSGGKRGYFVLCRAGSYKEAFLLDSEGNIISQDVNEALRAIRCTPDQPSGVLPRGYQLILGRAREAFASKVRRRYADQAASSELSQGQRYVIHELQLLYRAAETPEKREQVQLLEEAFRQTASVALKEELNRLKRNQVRGDALFRHLIDLYYRHDLMTNTQSKQKMLFDEREWLPIIVCSEAL